MEILAEIFQLAYVFLGFLLGIMGDQVRKFLIRPVLDISINTESREDCHKTYDNKSNPLYSFRFRIKNMTTLVMAEKVEAIILKVFIKNGPARLEYKKLNFMPLNLCWSFHGTKSLTKIQPKLCKFLDLGYLEKNSTGVKFHFSTVFNPNNRINILDPGAYEVKIVFSASNMNPIYKNYYINFDGKWSDDEEKMLSENIKIVENTNL